MTLLEMKRGQKWGMEKVNSTNLKLGVGGPKKGMIETLQ